MTLPMHLLYKTLCFEALHCASHDACGERCPWAVLIPRTRAAQACRCVHFMKLFSPFQACISGGCVLMALVGVALPLAITYAMESHARRAFLRSLA